MRLPDGSCPFTDVEFGPNDHQEDPPHFTFEIFIEFFFLEQFSRVAEAYEVLRNLETRAVFDQFGEEGLKNGLPKKMGGWSEGYTFHGDAKRVFRDFFGTDNPFADFQVNH